MSSFKDATSDTSLFVFYLVSICAKDGSMFLWPSVISCNNEMCLHMQLKDKGV